MALALLPAFLRLHLEINFIKNDADFDQKADVRFGSNCDFAGAVKFHLQQEINSTQVIYAKEKHASSKIARAVANSLDNNPNLIDAFYASAGIKLAHVRREEFSEKDMHRIMDLQYFTNSQPPALGKLSYLVQKLNDAAEEIQAVAARVNNQRDFLSIFKGAASRASFTDKEVSALFASSVFKPHRYRKTISMAGKRLEMMQADEVNHLFRACKKAYKEYADWYGALKLYGNPSPSLSTVSSFPLAEVQENKVSVSSAVSPFSPAEIQANKVQVGTTIINGVSYNVYAISRKAGVFESEDEIKSKKEANKALIARIQANVSHITDESLLDQTLITDLAVFKIDKDKVIHQPSSQLQDLTKAMFK